MRRQIKRSFVAIIGSILLLVGIVMIPYPGPGWFVVFAALGILGTEFAWARRLLKFAKHKYDAWAHWVASRGPVTKSLIWLSTAVVVIVTIWLVNGYGIINDFLNLEQDWVYSPFFHT